MVTPVTSLGSRSGVNWIRLCEPCTELAIALASEVFPVPGKSSISRWPSDTRQVSASRTMCCLPSTACSTLVTSAPKARVNQLVCSDVTTGGPAVAVVMFLPDSFALAGGTARSSGAADGDGHADGVAGVGPPSPDALAVERGGAAAVRTLHRPGPVLVAGVEVARVA